MIDVTRRKKKNEMSNESDMSLPGGLTSGRK